jgi:hypothetical protein
MYKHTCVFDVWIGYAGKTTVYLRRATAFRSACIFNVQIDWVSFFYFYHGYRGLSALRNTVLHADLHAFLMCRLDLHFCLQPTAKLSADPPYTPPTPDFIEIGD